MPIFRANLNIYVLLVIQLLARGLLSRAEGEKWRQDKSYQDLLPTAVDTAPAFYTRSKIHCSVLCQSDSSCNSFFYNDVSRLCLRQRVVHVSPNDVVAATGWRYFRFTAASCPHGDNFSHDDYVIDRLSVTCYRVVTSQLLSWTAAQTFCEQNDKQLTVLEPVEKAAFIYDFMNANTVYPREASSYYLIGASRPQANWDSAYPASGPDHVWLDGQPLNFTATALFWHAGRPNNWDNVENVLALRAGYNFKWEDLVASTGRYFICERPLTF